VLLAGSRLESEEARFRRMTDGLPLIVWVHDEHGARQFVNFKTAQQNTTLDSV
jgi:PAS domain-containing protein